MKKLGAVIDHLIKSEGIEKPILQNKALMDWEEIVGKQIAKHSTPEEVKHGVMMVRVETPVWRNELTLRKNEIIEKLNKGTHKKIIQDIKFI